MIKRAIVILALSVSGCTLQMDNPFVKKLPANQKLLKERIASYELLEREAELVLSIKQKKHDAQEVGKPMPPKPG